LKSNASEVKSSPANRNYFKYLVILGLLGGGAFAFSDDVKHIYGAVRRSGRVVGTLAVCINE
jgi:aarF domain-containing kinase